MIASLSCQVSLVLSKLLQLYLVVLLIYAVVSWIPSLRGRWTMYLAMLIDPVIIPMRRLIPPLGGLDLSFMVLFIFVQWLSTALVRFTCIPY